MTLIDNRVQPKELFFEPHKPKYIYVASPYSHGDKFKNVKKSIVIGEELIELGFVPYLPLLSHFWNEISPHDYFYWLDYDMEILEKMNALLRLPGESNGADLEVARAKNMGIPIYYSVEELK